MTPYPRDAYGLIRRAAANAVDISDHELRTSVVSGRLLRLTPGVFVEPSNEFDGPAGRDRFFRLRSIAVATSDADRDLALSHTSAATMHGLALLRPDQRCVHLTNGLGAGGRIRAGRHVHSAPLTPGETVRIEGVAVTSLARTAVDVAIMGDFAQALTAFDGALRSTADRDIMGCTLAARRRGIRAAQRALPLATNSSESVGESWSRAQMIDAKIPPPTLQQSFRCAGGNYRVDFWWEAHRLIGEFDGAIKYGQSRRPGESIEQTVMREKRREDELRALGYLVLRWTWDDLRTGKMVPLLRSWINRPAEQHHSHRAAPIGAAR
ncbi:hypothetical protein GCM10010528_29940 [Gordonia defluvii]|uniref:Transcriptional regulator, AbiEi antitoxin, Type IV TA system n=1 Tax=Gordonia defluvii TaxID=283718 RepID=A0ABP6LQ29_9ACTN|nr:hypothetical protein [Gordonia sp. UBA5067]